MTLKSALKSLLATLMVATASISNAQVATFEFVGRLQFSNGLGAVGDPVKGRFSWDLSAQGETPVNGYPLAFYNSPATGPIEFTVGSHTVSSQNMGVAVFNGSGPDGGDMIDINGNYPIVVDGTTFANGYFSIRLASTADNSNVFKDTSLPASLDLSQFNTYLNYFQVLSGVVSNDVMADIVLTSITRLDACAPIGDKKPLCPPGAEHSRSGRFQCCP